MWSFSLRRSKRPCPYSVGVKALKLIKEVCFLVGVFLAFGHSVEIFFWQRGFARTRDRENKLDPGIHLFLWLGGVSIK